MNAPELQRVVIVEDHAMVLDGLTAVLAMDTRIRVVGTAGSISEFKSKIPDWDPTVVVCDYFLPDGTGSEVSRLASYSYPDAHILMISGDDRLHVLEEAIESGCHGFVSKGRGTAELADTIVQVGNGATVFPTKLMDELHDSDSTRIGATLTDREVEVLQSLASAYSVSDMVGLLGISENTTRNHIRAILSKLHARSQLDAVLIAVRSGIVDIS